LKYKVLGINVEISYFFLCAITLAIAFDKTGLFYLTFFASLLHEAAHLFFLIIFKASISDIKLTIGCVGVEYSDNLSKCESIICLAAGPFMNILIGLIVKFLDNDLFCIINLVLGVYNLLPAYGLDGGLILAKILEGKLTYEKAETITDISTCIIAALFFYLFVYGVMQNSVNFSLFLFFIYLMLPLFIKNLLKDSAN
jgi:stage IV sporulation protein FB